MGVQRQLRSVDAGRNTRSEPDDRRHQLMHMPSDSQKRHGSRRAFRRFAWQRVEEVLCDRKEGILPQIEPSRNQGVTTRANQEIRRSFTYDELG